MSEAFSVFFKLFVRKGWGIVDQYICVCILYVYVYLARMDCVCGVSKYARALFGDEFSNMYVGGLFLFLLNLRDGRNSKYQ